MAWPSPRYLALDTAGRLLYILFTWRCPVAIAGNSLASGAGRTRARVRGDFAKLAKLGLSRGYWPGSGSAAAVSAAIARSLVRWSRYRAVTAAELWPRSLLRRPGPPVLSTQKRLPSVVGQALRGEEAGVVALMDAGYCLAGAGRSAAGVRTRARNSSR